MHACIESYTKRKEIFTQEQWGKAMQACCHKKPYVVNHVAQKEIIDFTKLSETLMWRNVSICKIREIEFDPAQQNLVKLKYNFGDPYQIPNIFKKNVKYTTILKQIQLKPAYNHPLSLSMQKRQDIKTMIEKRWIPEPYKEFYTNLMS